MPKKKAKAAKGTAKQINAAPSPKTADSVPTIAAVKIAEPAATVPQSPPNLWKKQLVPPEKEKEFNWRNFLVPTPEKLLRTIAFICISIASFALFAWLRNAHTDTVTNALLKLNSLFFIVMCYVFASYTVERKIGILWTAVLILAPELAIIALLLYFNTG
jgi:hypothetical protein